MTQIKTLGRFPTLAEMRAYYNRDDVLSFLYDASQRRNVTAALFGKHWEIHPTSRENLREIINKTIRTRIEPLCPNDANPPTQSAGHNNGLFLKQAKRRERNSPGLLCR